MDVEKNLVRKVGKATERFRMTREGDPLAIAVSISAFIVEQSTFALQDA